MTSSGWIKSAVHKADNHFTLWHDSVPRSVSLSLFAWETLWRHEKVLSLKQFARKWGLFRWPQWTARFPYVGSKCELWHRHFRCHAERSWHGTWSSMATLPDTSHHKWQHRAKHNPIKHLFSFLLCQFLHFLCVSLLQFPHPLPFQPDKVIDIIPRNT